MKQLKSAVKAVFSMDFAIGAAEVFGGYALAKMSADMLPQLPGPLAVAQDIAGPLAVAIGAEVLGGKHGEMLALGAGACLAAKGAAALGLPLEA